MVIWEKKSPGRGNNKNALQQTCSSSWKQDQCLSAFPWEQLGLLMSHILVGKDKGSRQEAGLSTLVQVSPQSSVSHPLKGATTFPNSAAIQTDQVFIHTLLRDMPHSKHNILEVVCILFWVHFTHLLSLPYMCSYEQKQIIVLSLPKAIWGENGLFGLPFHITVHH